MDNFFFKFFYKIYYTAKSVKFGQNDFFVYFQDKHMLSRLLMLLNPNYASSSSSQSSASNRNRRPTRKKKPIINVVEEETWNNFLSNHSYCQKLEKNICFILSPSRMLENIHEWCHPKRASGLRHFVTAIGGEGGSKLVKFARLQVV